MKQPVNFRLSVEILAQIGYLSIKLGLTKTQVVEHAVKYYYDSYHESMAGNAVLPFTRYDLLKK